MPLLPSSLATATTCQRLAFFTMAPNSTAAPPISLCVTPSNSTDLYSCRGKSSSAVYSVRKAGSVTPMWLAARSTRMATAISAARSKNRPQCLHGAAVCEHGSAHREDLGHSRAFPSTRRCLSSSICSTTRIPLPSKSRRARLQRWARSRRLCPAEKGRSVCV